MSSGKASQILTVFFVVVALASQGQFDYNTLGHQTLSFDTLPTPLITKKEFNRFGSKTGLRNNFKYLGAAEGFENLKVLCMYQDDLENIWMGDEGTFSKFTGREIWHYTLEGTSKPFYAIIQDDEHNMWFCSNGGGIIKYDGSYFLKVIFPDSTMNQIDMGILDVVKDSEGTLFFASTSHGVLVIKGDQIASFSVKEGLSHKTTVRLHIDPEERLWVGYWNKGVSVLEYGIWYHFTVESGLAHDLINSIDDGLNGQVLVSTRYGVSVVHFESGEVDIETLLNDKDIAQAAVDRDNRIWFAVKRKHGCLVMDGDSIFEFNVDNGLVQERAMSLMKDSRQNMWIGSFSKGASLYGVDLFDHFNLNDETKLNDENKPEAGRSYGLLEDEELGILIGGNGGVHQIVNGDFVKTDLFPDLKDVEVYDIFRQSSGELWVSAGGQGIFRKNQEGEIDLFTLPKKGTNWIFDIAEGANGQIYFVGYLGLMELKNDSIVHVRLNDEPVRHQMRVIELDPSGTLWMGSEKSGLIAWNYDDNTRTYADSIFIMGPEAGIGVSVNDTRVMDVLIDSEDNFWMTLMPGGLYRTERTALLEAAQTGDTDSLNWWVMSTEEGLPGRWTSSLILENPGKIWVGTNAGIAAIEFNESDTTLRSYGHEFGLLSEQIIHNNAFKDSENKMWWTSENYLVRYNPELDYHDAISPIVHITEVTINSADIDFSNPDEAHPIEKDLGFFQSYFRDYIHYDDVFPWTNLPEGLVLSYDQNNLAFDFSAPVWDRPEMTWYEAKLEGRDEEWTVISKTELYRCFHLNPGDYTLKIRAYNADGLPSQPDEYVFSVMPPIWQTKGFYGFILLIIITGAVIYFRHRVKALKKENIKLENAVLRRTEELRRSKKKSDDLLLNILPEFTADELKETGKAQTREFSSASVLFSDFEGFTKLSQTIDSQELVGSLDEFFIAFDELSQRFDIEKIKTIGDSYMCASGIPVEDPHHAIKIVAFGIEMMRVTNAINERRKSQGKAVWKMRIGVHSGPLIAGVVGKKKFAFDIWGDTVNTAARMEQNGIESEINVSEATFKAISHVFEGTSRGLQEVKGKGKVEMSLISGYRSEFRASNNPKYAGSAFNDLISSS